MVPTGAMNLRKGKPREKVYRGKLELEVVVVEAVAAVLSGTRRAQEHHRKFSGSRVVIPGLNLKPGRASVGCVSPVEAFSAIGS
jgi:hypothetical protein